MRHFSASVICGRVMPVFSHFAVVASEMEAAK